MERETPPEVKNPGAFKKGHEKLGGRQVGTHNATTKLLKECILMAAELEGSDGNGKDELVGFLRRLANEDIRAFAMLLGRVLPLQQIESVTTCGSKLCTTPSKTCVPSWLRAALR